MIHQGQRVLSGRRLWQRGIKRLAGTTTTEGCGDTGVGGGLAVLIVGSVVSRSLTRCWALKLLYHLCTMVFPFTDKCWHSTDGLPHLKIISFYRLYIIECCVHL